MMKMSIKYIVLSGWSCVYLLQCSVWVVRSMSKKRWLMSIGYECPFMVQ